MQYRQNAFSCCIYRRLSPYPPYVYFYRKCFNIDDCPKIWQGYELIDEYNVNDCDISCPEFSGPMQLHEINYSQYNYPQYVYLNYYPSRSPY